MLQVKQDGRFTCDHDWSLLVYYRNAYQPHLLRETGERSATGFMRDDLLMLNLFPEMPENSYSNKNEIVFVVDRSGEISVIRNTSLSHHDYFSGLQR